MIRITLTVDDGEREGVLAPSEYDVAPSDHRRALREAVERAVRLYGAKCTGDRIGDYPVLARPRGRIVAWLRQAGALVLVFIISIGFLHLNKAAAFPFAKWRVEYATKPGRADVVGAVSIINDKFLESKISRCFSRICGNSGVISPAAYQDQLPNKQTGLRKSYYEEAQCKEFERPRIISDPLRFKSEFLVNKRFFIAFLFFLVGFGVSAWSGKHFYDKRYFLGASLIGCGWLCALCSWWVVASLG